MLPWPDLSGQSLVLGRNTQAQRWVGGGKDCRGAWDRDCRAGCLWLAFLQMSLSGAQDFLFILLTRSYPLHTLARADIPGFYGAPLPLL